MGLFDNLTVNLFDSSGQPDSEESGQRSPGEGKRRTTVCTELSLRYQYRRAFSEVRLLEAMRFVPLEDGHCYSFITAGDVDALSYLKVVLDRHDLDYVLMSTWCMAAEDVLQLREWYEAGRIRALDMYVGEIFPGTCKIEYAMVKAFYNDYPEAGRCAVFRNHSKIFAGCNESDGFYFGIQTSANVNTNPRTENGCIIVDKGIYDFYREYFDGIISFE